MSTLTTETKLVYVVTLYDEDDLLCGGPIEFEKEDIAVSKAATLVEYNVHIHNKYFSARIDKTIVPVYK